jgi:hypothetical protein
MTPETLFEEQKTKQRQVFLMTQDQIDHYWGDIVRVLGEVPGYYEFFTPEWTYKRASEGGIQVWGLTDGEIQGIVITQILVFPAQKAFEILGAGGPGFMKFFDEMEATFEYIAADSGCQTIISRSRPGLARLLARRKGAIQGAVWVYRPIGKKVEH